MACIKRQLGKKNSESGKLSDLKNSACGRVAWRLRTLLLLLLLRTQNIGHSDQCSPAGDGEGAGGVMFILSKLEDTVRIAPQVGYYTGRRMHALYTTNPAMHAHRCCHRRRRCCHDHRCSLSMRITTQPCSHMQDLGKPAEMAITAAIERTFLDKVGHCRQGRARGDGPAAAVQAVAERCWEERVGDVAQDAKARSVSAPAESVAAPSAWQQAAAHGAHERFGDLPAARAFLRARGRRWRGWGWWSPCTTSCPSGTVTCTTAMAGRTTSEGGGGCGGSRGRGCSAAPPPTLHGRRAVAAPPVRQHSAACQRCRPAFEPAAGTDAAPSA